MLRLFPAGPLFSGTSPGRAVLRGRALCAPKRLHRPAHRHGLGGVFPSRAASGEYWAGTSGTFRPRQAGLSLAAFPGGFARWASSRTHWAAISTACFSPKSFDASLHKAARGIRPLWMPRAAFSLKGICAVRFAGRLTGFPLCLSVLCAQGPPCAFPAYFCKPAACAAGFFHFSAPRESCCPAAETIAFTSAIVLPSARRRRSRRMRSTLWARR